MNSLPPLGAKVKYQDMRDSQRRCTGTVVAHYPGHGEKRTDPETGEAWIAPDHAGVRVDKPLPKWWPYNGTDRFAPSVENLEPLPA